MSRRSLLLLAGMVSLVACAGDRADEPLGPSFSPGDPAHAYQYPSAGGRHSCVSRVRYADGFKRILCWGLDSHGQIGNSTTFDWIFTRPVEVVNSGAFFVTDGGWEFTCAVIPNQPNPGFCWGSNTRGQLGINATGDRGTPTAISTPPLAQISAGREHACGLTAEGVGYCWGFNSKGQLGLNNTTTYFRPQPIYAGRIWKEISAGAYFTCGVERTTFKAYCWGDNSRGQLGTGDWTNRLYPSKAVSGTFPHQLSAGDNFACGIGPDGYTRCWGDNAYSQVSAQSGTGGGLILPSHTSPITVSGLRFLPIAVGAHFACGVVNATGNTYCWGRNHAGQLGMTPNLTRNPVRQVQTAHQFYQHITAGEAHIVGVNRNGAVVGWGSNDYGQLGIGTTSTYSPPAVIIP
jgi:alpha-tubulin suppressor-like RCC1 family protein